MVLFFVSTTYDSLWLLPKSTLNFSSVNVDAFKRNLTKNIVTPLIESDAVPLEDGFVYRTFTPSHGGFVKNNLVYNRSYGVGDVKI